MPALAERSAVRRAEKPTSKEHDTRSKRAYMFISGGLGTDRRLVGIEKAVKKVTGSEHVKVMNSVISMDPENPKRHEQQAEFIKSNIEAGREVEVITHSVGSLEAIRGIGLMQQLEGISAAVKIIEEQVPGFFDDPERASKLTLNYTASSGFDRGIIHEAKFLMKYFALGGTVNRAINAATAFTPQNMSSEELADAARLAFGKKKKAHDMPVMPFKDTDGNYQHLPEAKQEKLGEIDEQLKEAAAKGEKWKTRRLFKKRGKLVSEELQNVFDGKYVEGNDVAIAPPDDFVFLAKQPQVQKAIREMVSKSIFTATEDLLSKGVKLKVAHFELDRAITRKSVNYFLDKTATARNRGKVREVEMLGHSGLVLQAENYIDAVTKDEPDRQVLLLPGIFANMAGLSAELGIGSHFEQRYGKDNAFWVTAAVSADKRDPNRYREIAEYITDTAKAGPVDLYMESLGVAELPDVIKAIKKANRKFLKSSQAKANLRIVTIGQSGAFKGIKERKDYLLNYAKLARKPGMVASYMFPIEGLDAEQMHMIYSDVPQKKEGGHRVPYADLDTHDEFLTADERVQKEQYDQSINEAVAAAQFDRARDLAEDRGQALAGAMQAVSDGKIDRDVPKAKTQWSLHGTRVLFRTLSNKQTRTLRRLHKKGFVVDTIHGELETVVPLHRSERVYPDAATAERNTVKIEGAPHAAPIAQARIVADVVYRSGERKAS